MERGGRAHADTQETLARVRAEADDRERTLREQLAQIQNGACVCVCLCVCVCVCVCVCLSLCVCVCVCV
jgi:hypothetical protein